MAHQKGSRAIIFYKRGEVAVLLHIFPKSSKTNLTSFELEMYLTLAEELEKVSDAKLEELKAKNGWKELEM